MQKERDFVLDIVTFTFYRTTASQQSHKIKKVPLLLQNISPLLLSLHFIIPWSNALILSAIATLAACLITIPQFMLRKGEYLTQPGASYYIEVCLIFINILLTVVTYLSYAKARKTTFPKQRNPYEITAEHYGWVLLSILNYL